jgi:hypothetical protein
MGWIPALLNDSQAFWNFPQQEGSTEAVKIVWAIENGHAPLRLQQAGRRIDLDLTRFRLQAVSPSIKTACCHFYTRFRASLPPAEPVQVTLKERRLCEISQASSNPRFSAPRGERTSGRSASHLRSSAKVVLPWALS